MYLSECGKMWIRANDQSGVLQIYRYQLQTYHYRRLEIVSKFLV